MCGICGYVSLGQPVSPVIREILVVMERYRLGYESSGIATLCNGKIVLKKSVGSVDSAFPIDGDWSKKLLGNVGIGHVRYPSEIAPVGHSKFAHPFISCDSSFALVHNGTIYDFGKIRSELSRRPKFSSYDDQRGVLNDSEVIVHLLEEEIANANDDMIQALRATSKRLSKNPKNQFIFALISLKQPCRVYAVSGGDCENKRKIAVAHSKKVGSVFASYRDTRVNGRDPIKLEALRPHVDFERDKFEVLNYDTLAILSKDGYRCLPLNL